MSDLLAARLPLFIGAVLALSFLLLLAVFRSVLVPVKAVVMNLLFSVNLRYYTGPCVFKSAVAKRFPMGAQGSLFVAELLVRLLRAHQTYVEVGLQPLPRSSGSTKTFRIRNVVDVFTSVMRLFWELRVHHAFARTPADIRTAESDPAGHPR